MLGVFNLLTLNSTNFNSFQNILAHTIKVRIYIIIRISQNSEIHIIQIFITLRIRSKSFFFKVLSSVNLNHKFCRSTIEINNVRSDNFLPMYGNRKCFQKIIPEVPFFFCHFFSEFLRILFEIIIGFAHQSPFFNTDSIITKNGSICSRFFI